MGTVPLTHRISKYSQNTASLFGCYFSASFNGILIILRIYRHEEQSTTKVLTNKKTEDAANEGAAIEREKR